MDYPRKTESKVLGTDPYVLSGFSTNGLGTVVKVRTSAAGRVLVEDGVIDDVYRVLDMTSNAGSLTEFTFRRISAIGVRGGFSRIRRATNGLFEDCEAIGLGRDGSVDSFPSGFVASDLPTTNVTYRRCIARGFWTNDQTPGKYKNGDGFADEEEDRGMVYEDCEASNNADGGIDTKSHGVVVLRTHCEDNHRNFRLWGSGTLTDIMSVNPRSAHIWAGGTDRLGDYRIESPQFVGGSDKPHLQVDAGNAGATITVVDPIVPAGETFRVVQQGSGELVTVNVVYSEPEVSGCEAELADLRARFEAALVRGREIADLSASAPGGSGDKSRQIARIHELATRPL